MLTIRATPLARRLAHRANLDLRGVSGTGSVGRVTKSDVLAQLAPPVRPGGELAVEWLGCVAYAEATEIQMQGVEARRRGEVPDRLLLLEHPAVVTLGRGAREENLLASRESLARRGVEIHRNRFALRALGIRESKAADAAEAKKTFSGTQFRRYFFCF